MTIIEVFESDKGEIALWVDVKAARQYKKDCPGSIWQITAACRHRFSNYEELITAFPDSYEVIRGSVNEGIQSFLYPDLKVNAQKIKEQEKLSAVLLDSILIGEIYKITKQGSMYGQSGIVEKKNERYAYALGEWWKPENLEKQ